jgi:mono/diheme cytochrome c family protein
MKRPFIRKRSLRCLSFLIAAAIGAAGLLGSTYSSRVADASASGPTPSHTNAPGETNCTACHGDFGPNTGTGNILISGIPANYRPGQTIPITVTVNQSDAVIYGFQLTAIDRNGGRVGSYTLPGERAGNAPDRYRVREQYRKALRFAHCKWNHSDRVRHEIMDVQLDGPEPARRQDRLLRSRKRSE